MSNSIDASLANYGLVGALVTDSQSVSSKLDTLTQQASTGLVASSYAGLGTGAGVSLNLSPQVASLQVVQTNIGVATGQMGVMQAAMSQIQEIATNFVAKLPSLNALDPSNVDTVAADAQTALQQVADLLNTQDGGVYIFGGQDSGNPPVPSGDNILSSGFFTQINAAVSQLTTSGASATTAATLQIGESNDAGTTPFSAYLSQPGASAQVVATGGSAATPIGILANANTAATSTGTSTTGSYMRDLMRALATIGSMSSSQADDPSFAALVQDTTTSLNGAVTAMDTDVGVMGDRQTALTNLSTTLSSASTALSGQISTAQDVDMAATLSKLTSVQTQLQASYKLIASAGSLSLVNFLPNG
jgi:flagellin-like hook-associated protein FlgL